MKIALAAMGSRGDAQPMLALGRALRQRGHDVIVSAAPDFAAWAAELGLPFVPAGVNVQAWLHDHWRDIRSVGGFRRALKSIAEEIFPPWFEGTLAAADGADMIVSASQFAAPSVAEKLGIPCIGVAYSPLLFRSPQHPPPFVHWQGLPRWVNSALWPLTMGLAFRGMRRYLNAERARLGLAAVRSVEKHFYEDTPYLLACDPVIAPPPAGPTAFRITATGPWFYDDPTPLDPDVEAFVRARPAPVYVGFGSMPSSDAARLTRAVLAGAGANGRRVLMSRGWAGLGEGDLPPTVKVVHGPMPHAKLFPLVAAVVHHGGAGTMATALRAGVPQVIVPHLADQFHHAHRLAALNIAPRGIPISRLDEALLARAIDEALALPPQPRIEAAARLAQSDGKDRAIAYLEDLRGRRDQNASDCQPRRSSLPVA